MLTHPTLDQLNQVGLYGMAKAFGEVIAAAEAATLTHAEWLALLLDREMTYRTTRNSLTCPALPDRRAASTAHCSRS